MTTIRSSGRPQLSNIVYALGGDEVARISVNDSGPKAEILRRDPGPRCTWLATTSAATSSSTELSRSSASPPT